MLHFVMKQDVIINTLLQVNLPTAPRKIKQIHPHNSSLSWWLTFTLFIPFYPLYFFPFIPSISIFPALFLYSPPFISLSFPSFFYFHLFFISTKISSFFCIFHISPHPDYFPLIVAIFISLLITFIFPWLLLLLFPY